MTHSDPGNGPAQDGPGRGRPAGSVDLGERERLAYALSERFAPHVTAAAAAVREAEQLVEEARENLARAREEAAGQPYRSDRLVFVRAVVDDETEALNRKTTPKTVKVAYRHLLDRAVDLADAEVRGYHSDQAERQHERQRSVDACLAAERQAAEGLDAARAMQQRVLDAEQAARDGLAVMLEKLSRAGGGV